ncbi:MAG: adenosylcobinamide-phosphate synthase CbiB [Rhodospirillales bacterium]
MFTFGLAGNGGGIDPLVFMLIALILDAAIGGSRILSGRVRHPVEIIGGLVEFLDKKLNRPHRSQADRAIRGFLAAALVIVICLAAGWAVAWLTQNHDFGWIVELAGLVALLAQRSLYDHVRAVGHALSNESTEAGRREVSRIVGRDPSLLDEHGVARSAIESLAENFSDGVVAPVFWYLLFGFPGLLVYKAVNTMDSMIGHTSEQYRAYGMTAARLDDILNLIPARLSGLFIAMAALFTPKSKPVAAVRVMLRDAAKHRSPNAGWPEGAMAGALGLALAGPRRYANRTVSDPWIGDGTARAGPKDISLALYLFMVACLINGMWVTALAVIRYSLPG